MPEFHHGDSEEVLPLQKMRVLAFLFIPGDASFEDARRWLIAGAGRLPKEVNTAICKVHLEDSILKAWRVAEYAENSRDSSFTDALLDFPQRNN